MYINFMTEENKNIYISFWLLLMVSLIQIISFPWAINYSDNGLYAYLTIISRTIVQYWLFWFAGLYIDRIWTKEAFWKLMSSIWLFLVCLIIYSALSNQVFAIILDGNIIYLMLADSFAILSIFILCKVENSKKQF